METLISHNAYIFNISNAKAACFMDSMKTVLIRKIHIKPNQNYVQEAYNRR